MNDYKILTAKYLDANTDDFMAWRIVADQVVVVVDRGIAGGKKYFLPLSDLDALAEPRPADDLGIYGLPYRELQAIAKEFGVQANQKQADIIAELETIFSGGGEEE